MALSAIGKQLAFQAGKECSSQSKAAKATPAASGVAYRRVGKKKKFPLLVERQTHLP